MAWLVMQVADVILNNIEAPAFILYWVGPAQPIER